MNPRLAALAAAAALLSAGLPADSAEPVEPPTSRAKPAAEAKKPATRPTAASQAPQRQRPAANSAATSAGTSPGTSPAAAGANAKPAKATKPPEAAPPAAADCTVEAASDAGPVTYTVPIPVPGSRQRASQCLVAPKQAVALARKGALLVVDTRSQAEFERYRIPGSLNIPPAFVKTKPFLRDRAFVLTDDGQSTAALEQACEGLRSAGFKQAAVLRGGLAGWKQADGAIEGDLLAQRALNRMEPIEYAEEGGYGDWLVASVASAPADELGRFLPQAVSLPNGADDSKFAAALKAAIAKRARKGVDLKVLVVDDNGSRIDKLDTLLPADVSARVYFLSGGIQGYRRFWSEQAAIWAAAERGPKKPHCGA
jgi:rhodanese-related sulfurtransferase